MEWSIERADTNGAWTWGQQRQWDDHDWNNIIHQNLIEFEKLTWGEILKQTTPRDKKGKKPSRKKHHDMKVCVIAPEACNRWNNHSAEADASLAFIIILSISFTLVWTVPLASKIILLALETACEEGYPLGRSNIYTRL